jgi:prohibitin 1
MSDFGTGRGRVIEANLEKAPRAVGIIVVAIILLILLWSSVASIPTGHVGVLTLFGKVNGKVIGEGIHLVNPLVSVNLLSIRTQEIKESAAVPSSEGLIMTMDASLLFHLDPDKAADVFQRLGPKYATVVVEPTLRSAIREATASHLANALYSGEREMVAKQIDEQLKRELLPRGVIIEAILLRDIQLPQSLKASIETKQQAEQESLAMSFRLQKEKQEAERKRIEAAGIRDFQQIVAQGISPQLLEWKGIEATEKLADSKNAKVVVIGNPKNGLPLILGQ